MYYIPESAENGKRKKDVAADSESKKNINNRAL
jgi:hypothetical protein